MDNSLVDCSAAGAVNRGLPRCERLRSKKTIGELFATGRAVSSKPLRIVYVAGGGSGNGILVSVPKRLFKRAVDRNLLKRRIREAYRLNKGLLGEGQFQMAIMYVSGRVATYCEIEHSLQSLLTACSRGGLKPL